jgi:protein involved in sex pheromone biosynthesis
MSQRRIAAAALAAGLLLSGCASGPAREEPEVVGTENKTLEGAVIVKTDSMYVYYRHKCEHCGHVEEKVRRLVAPAKGKAIISAFLCSKCGKPQRILIRGR